MRVYISGRITGDPDYKRKFDEAEARLTIAGHKAVNPTEITPHHGKGATLEKHIADVLGIKELK